MIEINASDFNNLARDLDRAAASDLIGKIEPTVMRGAGNVQRAMKADMERSTHFGQVSAAITFDVDRFTNHVRAEVGPLSAGRTVGDLAHFAYFGGANGGGGTVPDPEKHLEDEAPNLEEYAGKILDDFLGSL